MEKLLENLVADFPALNFIESTHSMWSPSDQTIMYVTSQSPGHDPIWALFHELAHATLQHNTYSMDFELLLMEVEAWSKAKELAKNYGTSIDEDHIQDSLDTYRDWLDQRSTCPRCGNKSLQQNPKSYRCFNCLSIWQVSSSRFCRPYRRLTPPNQKSEARNPKQITNFQ